MSTQDTPTDAIAWDVAYPPSFLKCAGSVGWRMAPSDCCADAFAASSAPVCTEQVVKAPRAFDTELKAQAPVTDGDEEAFGYFETSPAPAFVAGEMDFDFGGFAAPASALSGGADAAADFFGETFVAVPPVATDENVFGEFQ